MSRINDHSQWYSVNISRAVETWMR